MEETRIKEDEEIPLENKLEGDTVIKNKDIDSTMKVCFKDNA